MFRLMIAAAACGFCAFCGCWTSPRDLPRDRQAGRVERVSRVISRSEKKDRLVELVKVFKLCHQKNTGKWQNKMSTVNNTTHNSQQQQHDTHYRYLLINSYIAIQNGDRSSQTHSTDGSSRTI
jgi:hypothetical protein